jgi:hypothetical protein
MLIRCTALSVLALTAPLATDCHADVGGFRVLFNEAYSETTNSSGQFLTSTARTFIGPVCMSADGVRTGYSTRLVYIQADFPGSTTYTSSTAMSMGIASILSPTDSRGSLDLVLTGLGQDSRWGTFVEIPPYNSLTGPSGPTRPVATATAGWPMRVYSDVGGQLWGQSTPNDIGPGDSPLLYGLNVASYGDDMPGNPVYGSAGQAPSFLPLPADGVAWTAFQVRTTRNTGGRFAAVLNCQRSRPTGGPIREAVVWPRLGVVNGVNNRLYLPKANVNHVNTVRAISPNGNWIVGSTFAIIASSPTYWRINADDTIGGPFQLPNLASGLGFGEALDVSDSGFYMVGWSNDGSGVRRALINTPAGSVTAESYFASQWPGRAQPPANIRLTSVEAVSDGSAATRNVPVFAGRGVYTSGPLNGKQVVWTFSPVFCGAADLGSTGGIPGSDGVLDNNDFVVFIDYFFTTNPLADVGSTGGTPGSDGAWNNNDFVVFIDQFFAGCP